MTFHKFAQRLELLYNVGQKSMFHKVLPRRTLLQAATTLRFCFSPGPARNPSERAAPITQP
jgi:hypothetical protein